jgi:hypothetical protein
MVIYGVGDTIEEATIDHNSKLTNFLKRCGEKGIKADADKIEAIVNMPKPTTMVHGCMGSYDEWSSH